MENEVYKKLKVLIEALTHSGCNILNEEIFKDVKKMCKSSQENISYVYSLVLQELKKKNSQIRLAAFQICKELFKRSVLFRENVLRDLNLIFDLTLEINSKKLPPPKSSAESLKNLVISTLKSWVNEYGDTHKKLKIAYKFFEKCKQVNLETLQVRNSAEQAFENEQQRRLRMVNEEKLKKVLEEFNSNKSEIEATVTSLSNCLSLLLPPAEEFFIPEHELEQISIPQSTSNNESTFSSNYSDNSAVENDKEDNGNYLLQNKSDLRECGISLDYNLPLNLNLGDKFKVVKTEENSSVIENAEDCMRLINNRFLPLVKKWIKVHCKCSDRNSSNIKNIIDLKEKLENIFKKYNSLFIDDELCKNNETDSDDDDFEEVRKEGYEETVNFLEEMTSHCFKNESNDKNLVQPVASTSKSADSFDNSDKSDNSTPTSGIIDSELSSDAHSKATSPTLDRKKKLLSVAPKLPYDIDLYHWEDEKLSAPTLISTKIDVDKFWGSAGSEDIHEIPNPDGVAALRTRVIEFSGTFEPVKWACRAPLLNGKLCPRKDRFKCPFHGKIVPRDEAGNAQNKDVLKSSGAVAQHSSSIQDFQDPEFLSDLQAATGLNLTVPQKRDKRRKNEKKNLTHKKMKTSTGALKILESKNLPGLVDVVKRQNNAYTRLNKKVFNRSSMKRVSKVLNKLDRNKFQDKFGDQFNYI